MSERTGGESLATPSGPCVKAGGWNVPPVARRALEGAAGTQASLRDGVSTVPGVRAVVRSGTQTLARAWGAAAGEGPSGTPTCVAAGGGRVRETGQEGGALSH